MGQGLAGVTARQEARPPHFFTPFLAKGGLVGLAFRISLRLWGHDHVIPDHLLARHSSSGEDSGRAQASGTQPV